MRFYDLLDDYVHDRPHHATENQNDDSYGLTSSGFEFDANLVIDLDEVSEPAENAKHLLVQGRVGS